MSRCSCSSRTLAALVLEEVVDRHHAPEGGVLLDPSVAVSHHADHVALLRPDGSALRAAVQFREERGLYRLFLPGVAMEDVPVGTRVFTV